MFGFHWAELLVILMVAVLVFGPKRLPEIGNAMGKTIKGFRKGIHEVQEETGYNELRNLPSEVASSVHEPIHTTAAQPQAAARQPATADTEHHTAATPSKP